jgi:SRSO17 transposase
LLPKPHQYCGAVGKQANCQVSVELVVSDGFVAAPVGGRLYLPQSWIDDPQRRAKAGVPAPVLGDAAYGNSFAFREHLRELNLEFFLQVTPEEHKGWIQEVPTTLKGKYRIGRRLRAPPLVHWHGDAYCVPSQRPFCSP